MNKHRPLSSFAPYRSSLTISSSRLDIVEDPCDGALCIIDSDSRDDALADGWRVIRENIPSISQAERIKDRLMRQRNDTASAPDAD